MNSDDIDGVKILRSVKVEMRDGICLSTDIYLPADNGQPGPFPVLVERTPYGKHKETIRERTAKEARPVKRGQIAASFAQRGYAVVVPMRQGFS